MASQTQPTAMQNQSKTIPSVRVFSVSEHPVLDLFGPTVQFFTTPEEADGELCVMKGIIPNGGIAPMHSHAGAECFFMVSGQQEVLQEVDGKFNWILCKPGDFIQVLSGAKHAFRNPFAEPAVSIVSTTGKLGRFLQEIGRIVSPGTPVAPPAPEELQHFMEVSKRYDYWVATPEENAAVGISLF
jgi:quercetin dioxygenase-like cupin family protein